MKKKLVSAVLAVTLSMGMSMTAAAAEDVFGTYNGYLKESNYSSMWIGDSVYLSSQYDYEIVSGNENVELDLTNGTLKFVDAGTTQIKVTPVEDTGEPEICTFISTPAEEAYVEYQIPESIKVGFTVGNTTVARGDVENAYIYHNCLFGQPYGSMSSMNGLFDYGYVSQGWVDLFFAYLENRETEGYWTMTFTRPGTAYIEIENQDVEPYAITIEEPVITTNLPKRVQTGTKMQMTTFLDNTELKDKKIEDIRNRDIYDTKAALGYQPSVEIIEGEELVERANGDYSNILSSSEDITFIGEGTVTFQITYEMLPFEQVSDGENVSALDEVYYSPEATFTVEVTPDLTSSVEVTDETDDGVTMDTSGLDLESICNDNEVDLTNNDVEILVSQEEVAEENSARLEQAAAENGYAVKTLNEIQMSLLTDGNKIADITDNFGSLKLNLYVGEEYAGQKAAVYQLHNGTEVITHDGLEVNEDGTVSITVDKLSTFAVAVEETKTNEAPETSVPDTSTNSGTPSTSDASDVQNMNSPSKSVQTGDTANLSLWMLLCLGSVAAITVLLKGKLFNKR